MAVKKAGVKGIKGGKGGKNGKKNGVRQSTSSLHVHQPPHHPPPSTYVAPSEVYEPNKKRNGRTCALACFAVQTYLAAIVLGIFVVVGCTSSSSAIKGVYIAELHANDTDSFSLQFGYFGGCVTVQPELTTSTSGNRSSRVLTHCVASLRDQDLEDVSESLWENLDLDSHSTTAYVQDKLNTSLPIVDHLQDDVFHWPVPVIHVALFILSGIMLFVACAGASRRKAWKGVVVLTLILCAFSLALSLATVLGTLQAMNAILEGSLSTDDLELENGLYLSRGSTLQAMQVGLVVIVTLFYVLMGALFTQRTPEGIAVIQLFQSAGAGLREKVGRR
ncbi:hypothetical protein BJX63DRAFT_432855 [Aspergillus granulosus]|uniref:Actin cortical patch SUR7/pH-response regulator PalI n=1 Tax=Aspergillus granulosus TaxID=176169 RepID=A0ABR4H9A5_9EURO